MTNPADSFFGESSKSAKFETVGETVGGPIVSIGEARQQTDFRTGELLTWKDGTPRMQLPVTVQTTLRDASDPTDDGKRTLYVKGEMRKAIGTALRTANAGMAIGGILTVTFSGTEDTGSGFPKKLYTATYAPPATTFFDGPAQAQQPVAPAQPAPVQQPAAPVQAGMVQLTPEQYAAMQAAMAQQQPVAPAQPEPQKASYEQYASAMGFNPPTEQAPF